VVNRRQADRAVDHDHAPRMVQQGGEVLVVNVEDSLGAPSLRSTVSTAHRLWPVGAA
jgi:hypothetical protein